MSEFLLDSRRGEPSLAAFAQAIRAVFEDSSVSEIFGGENQP